LLPPVAEQDAVDQGFDHRPVEHLDAIFAIADRHGCGLDIHLHDGGELGAFTFDLIVERTHVLGLAGKVTVSHALALLAWRAGARRDEDLVTALELATSGGAVLDLPAYGLTPGCTADLSLVPATTPGKAVVTHPPRTLVPRSGRIL
jgi:cytosine/adenosine deaminase-related metal-dependent hydrolase